MEQDYVNNFFRAHYPPDAQEAWQTDYCAGTCARRYTGQHKETHDTVFPFMVCADGLKFSVQGHFGAYSYPRGDFEDRYDQVEIMAAPGIPELAAFEDASNACGEEMIYPYVPVHVVNAMIAARGGLVAPNPTQPRAEIVAPRGRGL